MNKSKKKEVYEIPKEKIDQLQKDLNTMKDTRTLCKEFGQPVPILEELIIQLQKILNYLLEE